MKWSNHAYTRHYDLGSHEVAKGYIAQAIDVLSGNSNFTVPADATPEQAREMGEEIVAKARRILASVRQRRS